MQQDAWLPDEGAVVTETNVRSNLVVPLAGLANVSDIRVGGPGGQLAAIGGKRTVLLLDLDHPSQPLLSLKCSGNWDKVTLGWNPTAGHQHRLASSNQRDALVWNVDALAPAETISNASRLPLTGVAWSTAMPWLLATCSADAVVNLFDVRALSGGTTNNTTSSGTSSSSSGSATLRESQRPAVVLTAPGLAGASVLAWNRCNGWELATAHGKQLWLWDIRGGTGGHSGDPAETPSHGTNHASPRSARAAPQGLFETSAHASEQTPWSLLREDEHGDSWQQQQQQQRRWGASRTPRPQWSSPASATVPQAASESNATNWGSTLPSSNSNSNSGGYARRALTVHTQRILDLDWSYHDEHMLATCALDKTVKFWDLGATTSGHHHSNDGDGFLGHSSTSKGAAAAANSGLPYGKEHLAGHFHGHLGAIGGEAGGSHTTSSGGGSGSGSGDNKNSNLLSGNGINNSGSGAGSSGGLGGVAAGDSAAAFMGKLAHASDIRQLRFTPFGRGLVTISHGFGEAKDAPQTLRLWSLVAMGKTKENATPDIVCVFKGHAAPIVAFDWRTADTSNNTALASSGSGQVGVKSGSNSGGGGGAFQLVSLNRDLKLRLHAIEPAHLNACAYNPNEETPNPPQSPGAPRSQSASISGDGHQHQGTNKEKEDELARTDSTIASGQGGGRRVGTASVVTANSSSSSSSTPNSNKPSERSEGFFLTSKLSLESLKADLYPQTHHSTGLGNFNTGSSSSNTRNANLATSGGLPSRRSFGNILEGGPGATAAALYHGSGSSGGGHKGSGNGSGLLLVGGNQSLHSSIIHDEVVTLLDTVASAHAQEQRLEAQLNSSNSSSRSSSSMDAFGSGAGSAGVWGGVSVTCETSYSEMAQKRAAIFVVNLKGSTPAATATAAAATTSDAVDASSLDADGAPRPLESTLAAAEALEGAVAERDLDGSVHAETAEVFTRDEDDGREKVGVEATPLLAMAVKVAVVFPPRYPSDAAAVPTFAIAWHRPESTSDLEGVGSGGGDRAPTDQESSGLSAAAASGKASGGNLASSSAGAAASATSVSSSSAAALALMGGSSSASASASGGWPAPHASLAPKTVLSRLLRSMERVTRRCAAEASLCVGSAVAQLAQGLHELQNQVANTSRSLAAASASVGMAELGARDNTAITAPLAAVVDSNSSRSSISDAAATAMGSSATAGSGASAPGAQAKPASSMSPPTVAAASAQMKKQAALPAPRTSSAVFSGSGALLFFGPAKLVKVSPPSKATHSSVAVKTTSATSASSGTTAAIKAKTPTTNLVRTYRDLLAMQGSNNSSYSKGGESVHQRKRKQQKKRRSPSLSSSAADASAWGAVLPLNHPAHSLGPTPAAQSQANLTLGDLALGTTSGAASLAAAASGAAGTRSGKKERKKELRRRKMAMKKWNDKKGNAQNVNAFSSSSASETSDSDDSISDEDSSPSETSESVSDSSSSHENFNDENDDNDDDDTASRSSLSSTASSTHTSVSASVVGRGRDRLRLRRVRLQALPQTLVPGHPALASILRLPNPFNPTAPPRLQTKKGRVILSVNGDLNENNIINVNSKHHHHSNTAKLTDRSAHALAAIMAVAQRCRQNAKAVTKLNDTALPTSHHHHPNSRLPQGRSTAAGNSSPTVRASKNTNAKHSGGGGGAARVWLLAATACEGLLARAGVAVAAAASASACASHNSGASNSHSSSRHHVGVGSGTSGYSSCGAALVQRSLLALARAGDVQTLAAVVATLRASHWTRILLDFPTSDSSGARNSGVGGDLLLSSSPLDLEVWLAAYGDLLFRWGCHTERLEVLKYAAWPPNFAPRASPLYRLPLTSHHALNQGRRTTTTATATTEPALSVAAATTTRKGPVKSFSDGALNTSAAREEATNRRGTAAAVAAATAEAAYAGLRRNDYDDGRGTAPVGGWHEAQLEITRTHARRLGAAALALESLSAASVSPLLSSPTSSSSSPTSSLSLTVSGQDESTGAATGVPPAVVAAEATGSDAVLSRPFAADVVDLQRICFGFVCASCGDLTSEAPLCRPAAALDDSNSPTASSSSQQQNDPAGAQTRHNSSASKSPRDGDGEGKHDATKSSTEVDHRRGSIESPSGAVKMNRAARKRQARIEQASGLGTEGNHPTKPIYNAQGKATGMLLSSSPSSLAGRMFNKQATADPAGGSSIDPSSRNASHVLSSSRTNTDSSRSGGSTGDASIIVARPALPPPLPQVPFSSPLRLSATTTARTTAVVSTAGLHSSSTLRPVTSGASSYSDESNSSNAASTRNSRSNSGSRVVAHVALRHTRLASYAPPAAGSFLSGHGGAHNGAGSYSGVDGRGGGGTYLPAKSAVGAGQGTNVSTRSVWRPSTIEPPNHQQSQQSLAPPPPTRAYQSTGNLHSLAMSPVGRRADGSSGVGYKEGPQSAGRVLNRGKSFGASGSSSGGSNSSSMDSGTHRTAGIFDRGGHSSSSSSGTGGGCGQFSSACSLCRLPVRGSFLLCTGCGHGGHPAHLAAWFYGQLDRNGGGSRGAHRRSGGMSSRSAPQSVCPTGCGCRCPEVMAATWSATRPATNSA